jgi:hypothetical protein
MLKTDNRQNRIPHMVNPQHDSDDPFDLNRFVEAQEPVYEAALAELRRGRKESHWMWFIFPSLMDWEVVPPPGSTPSRASLKPKPI